MSGAGQRPTPQYVWAQMQTQLTDDTGDADLDESPEFRLQDLSWPVFLAILLAHGWFLRPRALPIAREGDKPSAQLQSVKRRIVVFVGAWIAAFAFLPTSWVALGLVVWIVLALPGVVEIHRQFQHVPTGEPDPV